VKRTDDTHDGSIFEKDGEVIYGMEDFLAIDAQEPEIALFRKHERTGRPLGVDSFIGTMELLQKPGPKKKDK